MIQLVAEKKVSEFLKVSLSALRSWRLKKIGPPYYKLVGNVRYDLAEVEEWFKNQKTLGAQ